MPILNIAEPGTNHHQHSNQSVFESLMPLKLIGSVDNTKLANDSMQPVEQSRFPHRAEWTRSHEMTFKFGHENQQSPQLQPQPTRTSTSNETCQATKFNYVPEEQTPPQPPSQEQQHQHSEENIPENKFENVKRDDQSEEKEPKKEQENENEQREVRENQNEEKKQEKENANENEKEEKQEEEEEEEEEEDHEEIVPIDARDHNKIIKLLNDSINELNDIKKVVLQMIRTNDQTKTLGISLLVGGSILGGTLLALSSGLLMPMLASSAAVTGFLSKIGIQSMLLDKQKHLINNSKIILNKAMKRFENHPRIKQLIEKSHQKLEHFQSTADKNDHNLMVKTLEDILHDLNDSLNSYKAATGTNKH